MYGYLWTRLLLGGQLVNADLNAFKEAQDEQEKIDAKALNLTNQALSNASRTAIDPEALRQAIENSSAAVRVQIFYQAKDIRSRSWQRDEDKPRMERTIPIFEALIRSDKENRFHQNHAQLGFALKDKHAPEYKRALDELTNAIGIRGPASQQGLELYEWNRAYCRIKMDPAFEKNKASSIETRTAILDDLQVAVKGIPDLFEDKIITTWMKLNEISEIHPV